MDQSSAEVLTIYSEHSKKLASMFSQQGAFMSALFFLIFRSLRIHVEEIGKQLDLVLVVATLIFNGLMTFASMAHTTEALLLYNLRNVSIHEKPLSLGLEWASYYLKASFLGFASTSAIGLVLEQYLGWGTGAGAGVGVSISAGAQLLGVTAVLSCNIR